MRYKWAIVVAVLVVLGFGGYYLSVRWSQLSMSISRSGSNVSASTSMELYEINLRRMEVDAKGKETGRVLE
jgi:type IV secretory pathway protease TraF